MDSWEVWEEVPVAVCWQRTGRRPLGARWVDVNKGDKHSPNVRFRLVAQEAAASPIPTGDLARASWSCFDLGVEIRLRS